MYSRRRRYSCRMKLRDRVIVVCFVVFVFLLILAGYKLLKSELQTPHARLRLTTERHTKPDPCDVIHIGMVCVTHESKLKLYAMLKSLFHYRKSNPIQFYIVVHQKLKYSLNKLFETWALPDVNVKFYYLEDADPYDQFTGAPNMLRLMLPERLKFKELSKIILLSTDLLFYSDIFELWNEFQYFHETQVLGIPTDKYMEGNGRGLAEVVLYQLDNLRKYGWNEIWKIFEERQGVDHDENSQILNYFAKSKLAYCLDCSWNAMRNKDTECIPKNKVVHQKSIDREALIEIMKGFDGGAVQKRNYNYCYVLPRQKELKRPITDKCSSFPESEIEQKPTLLYFLEYKYKLIDSDVVTLATQLSLDKFDLLEEIAMRWRGPMSITFYLTYEELLECIDIIKTSYIFKHRFNTGYHVVFKYGTYFHITYLRNVALNEVNTPYVFSSDIHEMPMDNLHPVLKKHLTNFPNMTNKALVVPDFESKNKWAEMPSTKQDVLEMLQQKKVFIAQEDQQPSSPTDYAKWENATNPYKVTWQNMYEPYVVVKSDVVRYDERFFADGLDKVSHIMELEAQGYEFYVLPNTFVVHEFHRKLRDKNYRVLLMKYKICLNSIQKQAAQDLQDKYGRIFPIEDLIKI